MIDLSSEWHIATSKSSGPGGQNVNKLETKVELRFHILESKLLSQEQKDVLLFKLENKLIQGDTILITSQEKRSQLENKEIAIKKFYQLLTEAFKRKKKRLKTKPSKGSKENRLKGKKIKGEIKKLRGRL